MTGESRSFLRENYLPSFLRENLPHRGRLGIPSNSHQAQNHKNADFPIFRKMEIENYLSPMNPNIPMERLAFPIL